MRSSRLIVAIALLFIWHAPLPVLRSAPDQQAGSGELPPCERRLQRIEELEAAEAAAEARGDREADRAAFAERRRLEMLQNDFEDALNDDFDRARDMLFGSEKTRLLEDLLRRSQTCYGVDSGENALFLSELVTMHCNAQQHRACINYGRQFLKELPTELAFDYGIHRKFALAYMRIGAVQRSQEHMQLELQRARRHSGDDVLKKLSAASAFALRLDWELDREAGIRLAEKLVGVAEGVAPGPTRTQLLTVYRTILAALRQDEAALERGLEAGCEHSRRHVAGDGELTPAQREALDRLCRFQRGNYYAMAQMHKKSLPHLQEALEYFQELPGAEFNALRYRSYLGRARFALGQYEQARSHCQKMLEYYRDAENVSGQVEALQNLAQIDEKIGDDGAAVEKYAEAGRLLLKHRLQLGQDSMLYTAENIAIFDRLTALHLKAGRIEEAFESDLNRRGLAIAESLQASQALASGGAPPEDRARLKELGRRIGSLQTERRTLLAGEAAAEERLLAINAQLLQLRIRKEDLQRRLAETYPEYARRLAPETPTAAEIQAALAPDELVLAYRMGAERPLVFALERDRIQAIPLDIETETLNRKLNNLHTLQAAPLVRRDGGATTAEYRWIATETPEAPRRADAGDLLWNRTDEPDRYELAEDGTLRARTYGVTPFITREAQELFEREPQKIGRLLETRPLAFQLEDLRLELQRELFQSLIQPALEAHGRDRRDVRRLTIVPDGAVYLAPFASLRDAKDRLLIENYTVKLIHSATVLRELRRRSPPSARHPLLAVGGAVYAPARSAADQTPANRSRRAAPAEAGRTRLAGLDRTWPALPGTGAELDALRELAYPDAASGGVSVGDPASDAHILRGVRANKALLLERERAGHLREYSILHFALHGLLEDASPDLNALVFSVPREAKVHRAEELARYHAEGGPAFDDPYLRLGEIKALDLEARLVTLSACQTSLGHASGGEGMIALPQAFLIAGARNVMASAWAVDDEATRELMEATYRRMLAGRGAETHEFRPAEALRAAQLELQKKYPDPYYWAAFSVYGD